MNKSPVVFSAVICAWQFLLWGSGIPAGEPDRRMVEFKERLSVPVPKGSKKVRIWIPVPASNPYQVVKVMFVDSPTPYKFTQDKVFGNKLMYIESRAPVQGSPMEIKTGYEIMRKEQRGMEGIPEEDSTAIGSMSHSGYLQSRGQSLWDAGISDKIKRIALEATKGKEDPMEKARALYLYVLRHMKYDKSGTGWGRGDPVYACDTGKGNCTDFHSFFDALATAVHIPTRFRMGIPLPESREGMPAGSYHCWTEFHIEGRGWIPVDISEAWKNPKKVEYFFGNLDADRILLSTGREISLSPPQEGAPLNFLPGPYIEIDGKPVEHFKLDRWFRNKRA